MENLTLEQQKVVDAFLFERRLKINAFAGTGKTTTLLAMANQTKERGIYLAFNRAIADEVKGKCTNSRLVARTTHSLALSSFRNSNYSFEKLTTNLQGGRISHDLDFKDISLDGRITLTARALGYIVLAALSKFCQSAELNPGPQHVKLPERLVILTDEHKAQFKDYIAKLVAYLWQKMRDPSDPTPLGHDGYLKLWSLEGPQIYSDFVLLDEAQDTNDAVLSVLSAQTCKVALVGDRHQQIYEWRGAINAMEKIAGVPETYLTQTFRFGQAIANCANTILTALGERRTLVGNSHVSSTVSSSGSAIAYLSRTNVGLLESIIKLHSRGKTVHVLGGTVELRMLLEDVKRLKRGEPSASVEFFGFSSWKEVCHFSESDEGQAIRSFVRLAETLGEHRLLQEISKCVDAPDEHTKFVSTAHKAKGREWESVELNEDFLMDTQERTKMGKNEETRLLYVSVTRAKSTLILPENLLETLQVL